MAIASVTAGTAINPTTFGNAVVDQLNRITDQGWTSWTPTITQAAAVTVTVTSATYYRSGRFVEFKANLAITGSGTGSSDIVLSLPVAASADYVLNHPINGSALIVDASATAWYEGRLVRGVSTSNVRIKADSTTVNTYLGSTTMTAGLASGDTVWYTGSYEAAS